MATNAYNSRHTSDEIQEIRTILESILEKLNSNKPEKLDYLKFCKSLYKFRLLRERFFSADLFGEPAWDILIDLYIAHREGRHISITSAGIASGAPATTALRWVGLLVEKGLIARYGAAIDKRITYVRLTDDGLRRMNDYFGAVDMLEHAKMENDSGFVIDL